MTEASTYKKPLMVSHILIGINILVFIFVFINGGTTTTNFIRFGAKYNYGIFNGEHYRLLTSMFLHGDITHLLFNSWALYILGRDVEMIFGKKKFLILYFAAGLTGSVFSYLLNDSVGVGASGGIFGLLGAHIYLYILKPDAYKRIFGTDMFVLIGFNLIYGFMRPNIDNVAHIAGLIGGCIAAFAVGVRFDSKINTRKIIALTSIIILISGGLLLGDYSYENSVQFYIDKAMDQLNNNDIAGIETLYQGQKKYPDDENLNNIIQSIEKWIEENN